MDPLKTLWKYERELWLQGIETFETLLGRDCLMVFPKPIGVLKKQEVLKSLINAPRWERVEMTAKNAVEFSNITILGYEAKAAKSGEIYEALCSSTYMKSKDDWVMIQHQQTPIT